MSVPDSVEPTTPLDRRRLTALGEALPRFGAPLAKVLPAPDVGAVLAALPGEFSKLLPRLPQRTSTFDANVEIAAWFLGLRRLLAPRGLSDDAVGDVCLDVARELLAAESPMVRHLKSMVARSPLVKLGMRAGVAAMRGRPSESGFVVAYVPGDGTFDYGIDITRCGIRRLFEAEGAGEFTRQMCRIDYVTTAANGIVLERSGTLGNGAERCDFRFRRAT